MKAPCPFCGSTKDANTREHWLPKDWGEYFAQPPVMLARSVDYQDQASRPRVKNMSPFDQQYSGICARCNNGWLRDLDHAAKHTALSLGLRQTAFVPGDAVLPLAASLYRASLMLTWGRRSEQGHEPTRFRQLYEHRRPPDSVFILLGKALEPWIHGGGYQNVLPIAGNISAVRLTSFGAIGYLWVQVIDSAPGFEKHAAEYAKSVKIGASGSLKQLWPNRRRTRVTLSGMRIGRTIADHAAAVRPLRDGAAPFPPVINPHSVAQRFPTEDSYLAAYKPPTKYLSSPR